MSDTLIPGKDFERLEVMGTNILRRLVLREETE